MEEEREEGNIYHIYLPKFVSEGAICFLTSTSMKHLYTQNFNFWGSFFIEFRYYNLQSAMFEYLGKFSA